MAVGGRLSSIPTTIPTTLPTRVTTPRRAPPRRHAIDTPLRPPSPHATAAWLPPRSHAGRPLPQVRRSRAAATAAAAGTATAMASAHLCNRAAVAAAGAALRAGAAAAVAAATAAATAAASQQLAQLRQQPPGAAVREEAAAYGRPSTATQASCPPRSAGGEGIARPHPTDRSKPRRGRETSSSEERLPRLDRAPTPPQPPHGVASGRLAPTR